MKLIIDIPNSLYANLAKIRNGSIANKRILDSVKNGIPLDDVKAENKGEWKRISPAGIYECSECGQNVMTSDIECYKFCHGCGARMKGGE